MIAEMNRVKQAPSALTIEVQSRVWALEQQYIVDRSDSAKEAWQAAQSAYKRVISSLAEKVLFFAKQAFLRNVGKNGKLAPKVPS